VTLGDGDFRKSLMVLWLNGDSVLIYRGNHLHLAGYVNLISSFG
jgi:hypothetical protein